MAGLIERSLLLGLGVLTLTRDKVKQFVDKLVEEGEVKPEEAPSIIDKLVTRGETEREELRKLVREGARRLTTWPPRSRNWWARSQRRNRRPKKNAPAG
jgi:polyhydroxyalkanoate synthesis regulator phasin